MTKKHKAIKATLDVGTHEEWNDDHIDDFTDEIDIECFFITPGIAVLWDVTNNAAGVVPTLVMQDNHAFAYLHSGNAQLDWSLMKYEFSGAPGNITHIDDAPTFTTAVWLEKYDIVNIVGEWGLMNNAVAPTLANKDGAYFRVNANKLYAVTGDGAAETTTDITPLEGIPEYGHYRVHLQATKCDFYVDDMETVATSHTTNLPTTQLTIFYYADSGGVADTQLYVDGVGISMLRYKG